MSMEGGDIPIFLEPGPVILPSDEKPKTGGIHEVKDFQNSVEIDQLARFAVDEHNKKQNKVVEFDKVVNAKEQVVAGTIYYLTLEVEEAGKKEMYEAKVWVKPWMNFKELLEFKPVAGSTSATDLVAKQGSPMEGSDISIFLEPGPVILPDVEPKTGGIHEVKNFQNSVEIDQLARFAVDEHNKKQNKVVELGRVVNAKEQVVAGTIYYLTLEVVEDGKKKMYEAKLWVKQWMNFKELQEFKPV